MRVLHVGAEMFPLLKTGGLADVTGALPAAGVSRDPRRSRGTAGGGQQGDLRRADDAVVWRL